MTVSVVERRPREASSPLNPAYTRFALRGLVVAGFAGGVRLLSGSAAHASDGHGGHAPDSTATVADLATELGGNGVDDFLGRPRGGAAPTPPAPATTQVAHPVRHNTSGGTGLGGLAGPLAPTGLGSAAESPGRLGNLPPACTGPTASAPGTGRQDPDGIRSERSRTPGCPGRRPPRRCPTTWVAAFSPSYPPRPPETRRPTVGRFRRATSRPSRSSPRPRAFHLTGDGCRAQGPAGLPARAHEPPR
jgi:hypothetical protein